MSSSSLVEPAGQAHAGALVYRSAHLRAALKPAGSCSTLVVTFDSLNHDTQLDRPGFAERWLQHLGYDAVHVTACGNDWYQYPDLPEALSAIAKVATRYTRTITYGSSMGGYAAIRFAARVGAEVAVAISPQFSIDPARAPFEIRWRERSERITFRWEALAAEDGRIERAYVFHDPHDLDVRHVDLLAQAFPVCRLPLPHAGHPAGAYVAETGLLGQAVQAILDDSFEPAAFLREARARRRRSSQYLFTLSRRQPERRRALAIRLAEMAVAQSPSEAPYLSHLAVLLEGSERDEEAGRLHRAALEAVGGHPLFLGRLALYCMRRGELEEAARLALERARLEPDNPNLREQNSRLLASIGQWKAAAVEARAAHLLQPSNRKRLRSRMLLAAIATVPLSQPLARQIYKAFAPRHGVLKGRAAVKRAMAEAAPPWQERAR